jgi:hypothetical protein
VPVVFRHGWTAEAKNPTPHQTTKGNVMTHDVQTATTASNLTEMKTLFGPPPILSTEKPELYDAMLAGLVASHKPWDFPSKFFVWLMANAAWDILRYIRHKNWTIDRRFRQHLAHQVQRAKALAEKRKQSASKQNQPDESEEFNRLVDLLDVVEANVSDVDEIFDRAAKEVDHARALEHGIGHIERLDVLHSTAFKRYNEAFIMLERYREVFSTRSREEFEMMLFEDREGRPPHEVAMLKEIGQ